MNLKLQKTAALCDAEPAAPTTEPKSDGVSAASSSTAKSEATVAHAAAATKADDPAAPVSTAPWGVDSMASIHLSGNKKLFTRLRSCPPISVEVADRSVVTTSVCGSVRIRITTAAGKTMVIPIENVYYHERFAANLLSLGLLTQDGWTYSAEKAQTTLTTPGGNRIQLSTRGQVSVLGDETAGRSTNQPTKPTVYNLSTLLTVKVKAIVDLHVKLGHMPFARLMRVLKTGSTLDVGKPFAEEQTLQQAEQAIAECKACCEGKMTRSWLGHRGLDKGNAPLEALHMDTYSVQLANGDRKWQEYGVPLSDPLSGWRYHNFAASKDEIANGVIASIEHAKCQFNRNIKRLYTNGGSEFINRTLKEYCAKNGIELRYSPARTPQLNGVAERSVRTCKDAVRTLLAHGRVPWRFWSYAAAHATFLWNRTHVCKRTGMTPYQQLYGKAPSAKHWGVFGCDAFVHVPREQRSTLAPKAEPCIYLGHNGRQNCANVYVIRTRKVIASRDVRFRIDSFTLAHAMCEGEDAVSRAVEAAANSQDAAQPADERQDASGDSESADGHDEDELGSNTLSAAASHQESAAADNQAKWSLQHIAGQRWYGRTKEHQFKCIWDGDYEPTWEPAKVIQQDAPQAVEDFRASLPPPRQSSRHPQQARAPDAQQNLGADMTGSARDSEREVGEDRVDTDIEPRAHMAMRAIQAMQAPTWSALDDNCERFRQELVCAVQAGIARLEQDTPQTYRQAITCADADKWRQAMQKEYNSCLEKGVWEEVRLEDLPAGANILPVKWVFKIKIDETGAATIYKARLTPKGFRQKEGVDYFDVFAPTGKYKTMRFGLSVTARWDHELEQLDVPTAFLNADLEEDVYMQLPEGYRDGKDGVVLRLKKSLYGLKQAPRNWSIRLKKFIVDELGYSSTVSDPCLFWRRSRTGRLMLLFVFVDDIQSSFHREDCAEWARHKAQLVSEFNTKDAGPSTWMLGMRITRDRKARTITLDQEVYVSKALEKYGYSQCTTRPTPEVVGAAHQDPSVEQQQPTDRQRFMEITGTLMYAAISTRPDIAHAVFYLASHMAAPTCLHAAAADRVMRYLAGTRGLGLIFGSRNGGLLGDSRGHSRTQLDVCAYADADWANSKGDRRSITGWVSKVNGDPISWASKKQRTVALSTCEAELYAEAAAIQEVLWLRGLLKELGLHSQVGSIVHGDNQSAIAVTKNGVKGERTKHVDVKYHFVTETVERGDVQLRWIPTAEQQADIFTKALAQPAFETLRSQLMATPQ
ncbi:MAG: reverse transcriptase domain-containing protein [Terracidiphilus sp.]|nr:reverse transcriptase domain-containing protein [Terracidiphilus sp.]